MALITIDKLVTLLVEPSATQQRIISQHLHEFGIKEIDYCQCAEQALNRLAHARPDLVISSMHLPDMTGTELLQKIRSTKDYIDTPYILISSETAVRYLEPMRQAGITAILPKPYKLDQLGQALNTTLQFLAPDSEDLEEHTLDDLRVLVVDDSFISRRQITKLLADLGIHHIDQTENGREAVTFIEKAYYDLIVTDYNMPEMDGKELIEYVRERSTQPGVPIVMITCESDRTRLAAVEQSGVTAICDKPFSPSTIMRILKTSVLS